MEKKRLSIPDPLERLLQHFFSVLSQASSAVYVNVVGLIGRQPTDDSTVGGKTDSNCETISMQSVSSKRLTSISYYIWKLLKDYSCTILILIAVIILLSTFDDYYLLLTNGISAFFEGAFGFGGSLVFLACNVKGIGWGGSVMLDCILASINLSYVAFLHRTDLRVKDLKYGLVQFVTAIIGLSLGIYYFYIAKGDIQKFLPFLIFGLLACFYKVFHKLVYYFIKSNRVDPKWRGFRKILAILAGFGLGSTNLEAPLSDMLFRGKGTIVPLFIVGLLVFKIILFGSLGLYKGTDVVNVLLIPRLAFFAFAFTKMGSMFRNELDRTKYGESIAELLKFTVVAVSLIHLSRLAFSSLNM